MIGTSSLRREERLRGRLAFEIVNKKGRSLKAEHFIVNIHPNNLTFNRIGISISSSLIHKSTKRNRLRRLIKEAYRLHKNELKKGLDIVVKIRPMAEIPDFKRVEKELLDIFRKGDLLI